jgi:outer membrane protein OmpA-like peptidoglycan-associated protein
LADLLTFIASLLAPGVVRKAAVLVEESPADTERALVTHVAPTLLAAFARLESSEAGASQLDDLIGEAAANPTPLTDLGSLFAGGSVTQASMRRGCDLLQTLFGGRLEVIARELASASGVKISSASLLLELSAPLVLAVLAREREARGLDTGNLATALMDERSVVAGRLTPGLRTLVRDAGLAPLRRARQRRPPAAGSPGQAGTYRAPLAVTALVLALIGAWLATQWRGCGQEREIARPVPSIPKPPAPKPAAPKPPALPPVAEGSFKHALERFLADPNATAPQSFVFEGLGFQSGRSVLEPESHRTVAELAAILQAYPTAEVRLEGHTDGIGKADANQRLSLERAEAVKAALIASGVAARRLDAQGFGGERPVASNDTEEGRAKNRRTELVVTRK